MPRRRAAEHLGEFEEMGLQLTPMIDVIFQLLLFFLVTIKFPTYEGLLKAFLPKADTKPTPKPDEEERARTNIQRDRGTVVLYVNRRPLGVLKVLNEGEENERVVLSFAEGAGQSLESMYEAMQDVLGDETLTVILQAEKKLPYKYVVYVLNVCGRMKITDVWFAPPGRMPEAS